MCIAGYFLNFSFNIWETDTLNKVSVAKNKVDMESRKKAESGFLVNTDLN